MSVVGLPHISSILARMNRRDFPLSIQKNEDENSQSGEKWLDFYCRKVIITKAIHIELASNWDNITIWSK